MNVHKTRYEANEDYADEQRDSEDLRDRLADFVGELQVEAKRRVDRRKPVEERWMEDLRQYHGIYDAETLKRFKANEASSVFLNLTRPKTNAMMARLWDLLFPTDDRNWGVGPTPVPELTEQAEEALAVVDEANATFAATEERLRAAEEDENEAEAQKLAAEMEEAEGIRKDAQQAADELQEQLQEASRRASLMEQEIEDQLKACGYQAECRDMIKDACKIGTGVLKGPILSETSKKRWKPVQTEGGSVVYQLLNDGNDARPAAQWVDPWSFFPDPDVSRVEDSEGFFERHALNAKKFRRFVKQSGANKDAARRILKEGPRSGEQPTFLAELNNLAGKGNGTPKDLYMVWEYTGPIEFKQLEVLAEAFEDDDLLEQINQEDGEVDPLEEWQAKIWFCGDEILKFAMHPLDSNEAIYSVFNLEEDENSLFGYGIPYIMRDPQAIVNAGQRMMMDNSALSVGPQVVVDKESVTPENGSWLLQPRKIWQRLKSSVAHPNNRPFETFNIESNQAELANIIAMARDYIDEVTGMPQIAQGEQGAGVTKTAQGMAILMNSANVVFRRFVKNFDDNVTVPMIRRFYHWNMQFSDKDEIKGDYEADARGSSVLLVREMMAQNLIMIAQLFGDHPIYAKWLKHVNLLKEIFKAHMIPADELTKTDREVQSDNQEGQGDEQSEAQAMIEQGRQELQKEELALRREEIEAKREIANMDNDTKRYVAERTFEAAMTRIAEMLNISREQLQSKFDDAEAERASKERRLAVEVADKARTGVGAGGAV